MSAYLLTWVTKNLAMGQAPMSYAKLDNIKKQGIDEVHAQLDRWFELAAD